MATRGVSSDDMAQSRRVAKDSFGLDLRVATLPVAQVRAAGQQVLVTRYKVSEHYIQAVIRRRHA